MLAEALYLSPVPAPILSDPLNPFNLFFLVMILMMPDIPSGSYLAEGFVINSILSILLAGICCKIAALLLPVILEGFPSIKTVTFPLPRKLIFPSISTETLGNRGACGGDNRDAGGAKDRGR